MKILTTYRYLILLAMLLVFVLVKIPYLSLPHFWDEGWSYATAVQKMYNSGPTLLPGYVDVEATRGHPLMYYFLASSWMKIFGATVWSKHMFSLFISLIAIVVVFQVGCKLANVRVAILSGVLMAYPLLFFIQSTMLLPEILVAILSLLCIYATSFKKYILLAIALSMLLLTKESGFVMGLVLAIYFVFQLLKNKNKRDNWKLFVALMIPFILIVTFFALQYRTYGWLLFPEHIGMMKNDIKTVLYLFRTSINLTLIYDFKYFVLVLGLLIVAYLKFVKKQKLKLDLTLSQKVFCVLSFVFIFFYDIFCGINFFTLRYLMPVAFLVAIIIAFALDKVIEEVSLKLYGIAAIVIIVAIVLTYNQPRKIGDTTLGYKDAVQNQKEMVDFLAQNFDTSSVITISSYQMKINMADASTGFLPENKLFKNTISELIPKTKILVIDNIESADYLRQQLKDYSDMVLIKRIENGIVVTEIYENSLMK